MPPSPSSSAISSLAAKFAFKPSEAAKMPTVGSGTSPSRMSKRRLSASASASPTRSSPRKSAATASKISATTVDLKGKARQVSSTTVNIAEDAGSKGKKSASTSVNLQDDLDDGLDWELSDSEIAAVSDELLNSSAHKKIKLDSQAIVTSSSPSGPKVVASSSTKKVNTVVSGKAKADGATSASGKNAGANIQAVDPTEMPNEVAKDFLDSLSDEATEGKGGPLSHRQLLELEGRTMHPSWLTPLQKECVR